MLTLDAEISEAPISEHEKHSLYIPKVVQTSSPQAEVSALRETAKMLVSAQNPVIVVDRLARTPNGVKMLVELAELLQVPVMDIGGRMNFPNTHYLNQTPRGRALVGQADVIMGMEVTDFWNIVNGFVDNADNEGSGLQERQGQEGCQADRAELRRSDQQVELPGLRSASSPPTSRWSAIRKPRCRR